MKTTQKETTIAGCKKNIMGTISFDGQFPGMRKPQDFIVYPMQDSGDEINIQSDHRFGRVNLTTGRAILSANRDQYANSVWLMLCQINKTAAEFVIEAEELQTLRQWIKCTGGPAVGASIVISDNTGALAL